MYGTSLLQYGATEGFGPFRESVAEFLRGDGVKCDASQILPVQGGMDFILAHFTALLAFLRARSCFACSLRPSKSLRMQTMKMTPTMMSTTAEALATP